MSGTPQAGSFTMGDICGTSIQGLLYRRTSSCPSLPRTPRGPWKHASRWPWLTSTAGLTNSCLSVGYTTPTRSHGTRTLILVPSSRPWAVIGPAWQEADSAADSQHPAVKLADLKLAVDDFQCAVSLVQTFQDARGPDEYTTRALQTSVVAATAAYKTFATGFQQWATALARGEGGLPLEAAADFKVQNEKAAEFLISAAGTAFFALL